MALDIRLDFIKKINEKEIERMTVIRQKYIDIDNDLKVIADECASNPSGARTVALARTNLEIACQFSIKSLCILGEEK